MSVAQYAVLESGVVLGVAAAAFGAGDWWRTRRVRRLCPHPADLVVCYHGDARAALGPARCRICSATVNHPLVCSPRRP